MILSINVPAKMEFYHIADWIWILKMIFAYSKKQ
jgi:hypothetical protein